MLQAARSSGAAENEKDFDVVLVIVFKLISMDFQRCDSTFQRMQLEVHVLLAFVTVDAIFPFLSFLLRVISLCFCVNFTQRFAHLSDHLFVLLSAAGWFKEDSFKESCIRRECKDSETFSKTNFGFFSGWQCQGRRNTRKFAHAYLELTLRSLARIFRSHIQATKAGEW